MGRKQWKKKCNSPRQSFDEKAEVVFTNFEIVKRLLGEIGLSLPQVRALRRVNKVFNFEACRILSARRSRVRILWSKEDVDGFLERMESRLEGTVSFSTFPLHLWHMPLESVKNFVQKMSGHVHKYELLKHSCDVDFSEEDCLGHQMPTKVTTLLATPTPLLEVITCFIPDFELGRQDLVRLRKSSFPSLRSVFGINVLESGKGLIPYLVRKAPKFDYLALEAWEAGSVAQLGSLLCEPPRPVLPYLTFAGKMDPSDAGALEELHRRKYNDARRFSVDLELGDNLATTHLVSKFNDFLSLQTNLDTLSFRVVSNLGVPQGQIQIPMLDKLTHLSMEFRQRCGSILRPFTSGQFPVLKVLNLGDLYAIKNWFPPSAVFASVEELTFESFANEENSTFHLNFPKLKKLGFQILPGWKVIRGILTHCGKIDSLDLGIGCSVFYNEHEELWDIYSGGAPRRSMDNILESMEIGGGGGGDTGNAGEPSLASLQGLKKLKFPFSSPQELEALLLMSSKGKLPSLKKLMLSFCEPPPTVLRLGVNSVDGVDQPYLYTEEIPLEMFHSQIPKCIKILEEIYQIKVSYGVVEDTPGMQPH